MGWTATPRTVAVSSTRCRAWPLRSHAARSSPRLRSISSCGPVSNRAVCRSSGGRPSPKSRTATPLIVPKRDADALAGDWSG